MSTGQKLAWFFLVVIVLSLIVVVATTPVLGFKRGSRRFGAARVHWDGPILVPQKAGRGRVR